MHRFFVEGTQGEIAFLDAAESKHAKSVLRLRAGDTVEALDGWGGRFFAEIADTAGEKVRVQLIRALPGIEPPIEITLYQGLPKLDKLDFVVQKATELGVSRVVPVEMERSVARISGDAAKKQDRFSRIAREAAKQCGRSRVPEISAPLSWREALKDMRARELMLLPWEEADGNRIRDVFSAHSAARDIGILIGPEGGITSREIGEIAGERVTLGPRILRTETAAVAAVAIAMSLWGDV